MKKTLVNLYNLTSGGGLTIGRGFVEQMLTEGQSDQYIFVIPDKKRFPYPDSENIRFVVLPGFYQSVLGRFFAENWVGKRALKEEVEKVISLTNYGVRKGAGLFRQVLLIHWPYLAYTDAELWENMGFFRRWRRLFSKKRILSQLVNVDKIIVQTGVMKRRLEQVIDGPEIVVIPGYHNFSLDKTSLHHRTEHAGTAKRLIFVSNYYEHKNHEILFEMIKEIRGRNVNLEIHITINKNLPIARKLLEFSDVVVNLGELDRKELEKVYPTYDGLFFPTLVETFGIPYLEAMHFGLPVFTSDRDFARAVCGDYANYFDPNDAKNMLDVILNSSERKDTDRPRFPDRAQVVREILKA